MQQIKSNSTSSQITPNLDSAKLIPTKLASTTLTSQKLISAQENPAQEISTKKTESKLASGKSDSEKSDSLKLDSAKLDSAKLASSKLWRFARTISNIINPPLMGAFIVGLTSSKILEIGDVLKWLSLVVLLTIGPPLSYVIYLVKIGYLKDIYMPDHNKRLKPIAVIFVWLIISIFILAFINAPTVMTILIVAVLLEVSLLGVVTVMWKISFHAATVSSAATATLLLSSQLAWIMVPLVPLVGWTRVYLKRHTTLQVIGGWFVGIVFTVIAFKVMSLYLNF